VRAFPSGSAPESTTALIEIGDDPVALREARELAGFRSVWEAVEVEHSPALAFLHPAGRKKRATAASGGELVER